LYVTIVAKNKILNLITFRSLNLMLYHDDKDANEHSNEVSKEGESMLDVVQVSIVGPFNNVLCVKYYVAHE
jgi:hypothetical protein